MKPTAYVINLDRRADRWQRTQELWSPFFTLVRVSATDMPHDGARGCKLSHVSLCERVLADEPMVIVLEDDAEPTKNTIAIHWPLLDAKACLYEWDSINLSPLLDLSAIGLPRAALFPTESPLFRRCTYSHSTNCVIYNHRSLPILQASLASNLPVDMYLARHCKNQWVPICLLATQSFDDSDIRKPFPNQHTFYDLSAEMLKQAVTQTPEADAKARNQ